MNVFISGTSSGIGYQLANLFLKNNYKVWGCSRSDTNISHRNYKHFLADLTQEDAVKKLIFSIENQIESIDIFISNAGVHNPKLFNDLDYEDIHESVKVNILAPILLTKSIVNLMNKNKGGSIFFLSSIAANKDFNGTSLYGSAKSSIEKFSNLISLELRRTNISVFTIRLVYIPTKMSNFLSTDEIKILKKIAGPSSFNSVDEIYNVICKYSESPDQTLQLIS